MKNFFGKFQVLSLSVLCVSALSASIPCQADPASDIRNMISQLGQMANSADLNLVPYNQQSSLIQSLQNSVYQMQSALQSLPNPCQGQYSGYYQGLSSPLVMNMTPAGSPGAFTVTVYYNGQAFYGNGSCQPAPGGATSVVIYIGGAPVHRGTIYLQNGSWIFNGRQDGGFAFVISRAFP